MKKILLFSIFIALISTNALAYDSAFMMAFSNTSTVSGGGGTESWAPLDFTTFTVANPLGNPSTITETASAITFSNFAKAIWDDEYAQWGFAELYIYKDMGVSHYAGNFTHRFSVTVTAKSGVGYGFAPWMMADTLTRVNNTSDCYVFALTENLDRFLLRTKAGTTVHDTYSSISWSLNTTYYVKVTRSGNTVTASIYSDSAYSTLLEALSYTEASAPSFRYIYGFNIWLIGDGSTVSGHINNLETN